MHTGSQTGGLSVSGGAGDGPSGLVRTAAGVLGTGLQMSFAVKTRDCPPRQDRFPFLNNELLLDEVGWGPQMIRSKGAAERGPQPRVFPCIAGAPPRPANGFAGWGPAPSPMALTSCPHLAKPPPLPAPRVRQNEEAATVTQRSGMSAGEQTAEAPAGSPRRRSQHLNPHLPDSQVDLAKPSV